MNIPIKTESTKIEPKSSQPLPDEALPIDKPDDKRLLGNLITSVTERFNSAIVEASKKIQQDAIEIIHQSAIEDNAFAQVLLGIFYLKGPDGTIQSLQKILQYLLSSVNEHFYNIKYEINKISDNTQWFKQFEQFNNILNQQNMMILLQEIVPQQDYQQDYQQAEFCQFLCTNPTTDNEQQADKGSGKGHQFLSLIARKLGGHFPTKL